jgi:hypothetical protein
VSDLKRVAVVLVVGAVVVVAFGVYSGLLGIPLLFPCSAEEKAVFIEFPHYGSADPEVESAAETGGCAVFYGTEAPQERVAGYYTDQLRAHGWKAEKSVSESWDPTETTVVGGKPERKTFPTIEITAKRGGFYYEVYFESHELYDPPGPGAHVAVHLSED